MQSETCFNYAEARKRLLMKLNELEKHCKVTLFCSILTDETKVLMLIAVTTEHHPHLTLITTG